jgi:hypothetical protein
VAVTGAAIAAKAAGKSRLQRAGAYVRAHWKELLALLLAAIPAAFIVFHTGARKQAQSILTLPPLGAATPGGADASSAITPAVNTSSPSSTTSSSPSPTTPKSSVSVAGANPTKVAAPAVKNSSNVARTPGTLSKQAPAPPPAPVKKTSPAAVIGNRAIDLRRERLVGQ